jgi:negative regulator of flagellin synthesis FlgM
MLALGDTSVTDKISAFSTADPVAALKGSNGNGVVADKSQGEASAANAPAPQAGDTVTLTNSARSMQMIESAVANAPVVNSAKVAAMKQAVNSGTYQVNAGQVADKMLQFERELN